RLGGRAELLRRRLLHRQRGPAQALISPPGHTSRLKPLLRMNRTCGSGFSRDCFAPPIPPVTTGIPPSLTGKRAVFRISSGCPSSWTASCYHSCAFVMRVKKLFQRVGETGGSHAVDELARHPGQSEP